MALRHERDMRSLLNIKQLPQPKSFYCCPYASFAAISFRVGHCQILGYLLLANRNLIENCHPSTLWLRITARTWATLAGYRPGFWGLATPLSAHEQWDQWQ